MAPKTRKVEKLDLALDLASPVLDLLDAALDIVSVPGIGLIPKGLSAILESIKVARLNTKVRKEFKAKAMTLASIIEDRLKAAATKVAEDKTGWALEGIMHSAQLLSSDADVLKRVIISLVDRVSKLEPREPRVRGAIKGFLYGSRNKEALSEMQSELNDAVRAFQIQSQFALREGVNEIQRLLKRADEDRALKELAHADAGYRAVDYLKTGFVDGTRRELLDQIRLWTAGEYPPDAPKRFYALFGRAGMGKSAVAHRLCRHLSDGDFLPPNGTVVLGASFFFVRDSGDKASALLLPPTIASQLAGCTSHPILRTVIAEVSRAYIKHGAQQQLEHAFRELLEPLSKANATLGSDKRVVLVIDGLDECSNQERIAEMLTLLFTLIKMLPWLYIFTASRPEPHIINSFGSPAAGDVIYTRDLGGPSDSEEDVGFYIRSRILAESSPYFPLLTSTPDGPRLLQRLLDRAGGVFIFARIVCNFLLQDAYRDMAEDALKLILSPTEGKPLSCLDSLYLQILRSAFRPEDMHMFPHRHAHLLSFLHILVLNQDTYILTPKCLALLGTQLSQTLPIRTRLSAKVAHIQISLSGRDMNSIIYSLRSMLSTNRNSEVVPLHATLGEFLLDPTRCTDHLYQVNAGEGHAGLAHACLHNFSSLGAVTDILAGIHNGDNNLRNYALYALQHFDNHIASATWTEQLNNRLTQFVSTVELPLMARLSIAKGNPGNDTRYYYYGLNIFYLKGNNDSGTKHDQESASDASVPEEFLKFMAYSLCLMDHVRRHPEEDWPEISGEAAQEYLSQPLWKGRNWSLEEKVKGWNADQIEIERYRSVVLALKAEIDRDERARRLWYDFSITY